MININGHRFMTLADPIYINGRRVSKVYACGKQVYPCGPEMIKVQMPPGRYIYYAGEQLDYTGIEVVALNPDGSIWKSNDYPDGVIPFDELILPTEIAPYYDKYTVPDGEHTIDNVVFNGPIEYKRVGVVGLDRSTGRNVYSYGDAWNYGWATYISYIYHYGIDASVAICNFNNQTNEEVYCALLDEGATVLQASKERFAMCENMGIADSDWGAWADSTNVALYNGSGTSWNHNNTYTHDGKTVYWSTGSQRPPSGSFSWLISPSKATSKYAGAIAWYLVYGPSIIDQITLDVPVKWKRPDDQKLLETSFEILKVNEIIDGQ